jgi:hypothetical protein
MRPDMIPGAVFPDYELSDHTAKRRKLPALQGQNPMVLVLSRGGYCPKDRQQHRRLLDLHGDAQRQEYAIEREYVSGQQAAAQQLVTLYKSLGGGWQDYLSAYAAAAACRRCGVQKPVD